MDWIPLSPWNYFETAEQCANIVAAMGQPAALRRGVAPDVMDRPCRIFFRRHSVREMLGGLVDPMERRVIMAAKGLSIPPDINVDSLITFVQPMDPDRPVELENLRITKPAEPVGPAGVVVIWRMWVRR
jgi:hypothetical protein